MPAFGPVFYMKKPESSPKNLSRRDFLKGMAGVAAATLIGGTVGCDNIPEASAKVNTPLPTSQTKTETPEMPTATVTPESTSVPTKTAEQLDNERMARWQDKFWKIGGSVLASGGLELEDYEEEMQIFRNEVTKAAEENGLEADSVELVLTGNNSTQVEKDGQLEQLAPTEYYGLMVTEDRIACFTKGSEGILAEQDCGWFEKSQAIWGGDYSLQVVASPEGKALFSLLMKEEDENVSMFQLKYDRLGVVTTLEEVTVDGEMRQDENGTWILDGDVVAAEDGEVASGVLIIGTSYDGEMGTFLLECQPVELERDLKPGVVVGLVDYARGSAPVDMTKTDGSRESAGFFDLADGSWHGEGRYKLVQSILREETLAEKAPQRIEILGVELVVEDGKGVYRAEADNSMGLKEGEYAGELVEYVLDGKDAVGLVLVPEAVRVLVEDVNTTEAIAQRDWKIPFPLDIRGSINLDIRNVYTRGNDGFIGISGLSPDAEFLQPFLDDCQIVSTETGIVPDVGKTSDIIIPEKYEKGMSDHAVMIIRPAESSVGYSGVMPFSGVIVSSVNGTLGPRASEFQIIISKGLGREAAPGDDWDITRRIMSYNDMVVFLSSRK